MPALPASLSGTAGRGLDGANLGERAGAGDEGSGRGYGSERAGTDGDGADDPEQTP